LNLEHSDFDIVSPVPSSGDFGFRPARPCLFGQSASTTSISKAEENIRHNANRAMAGGYSDFCLNGSFRSGTK